MLRTRENLSASLAILGKISVSWISGLFVLMTLKGPRTSRAASGFGSQVSIWLGAPRLKIMMQERSSLVLSTAPWARKALSIGRERPSAPRVPAWRKSRREMPSQVVVEPGPVNLNMVTEAECYEGRRGQGNYASQGWSVREKARAGAYAFA